MESADSDKTKSVTQATLEKRHGKTHYPEVSDSSRQKDADEYDDPADEWEAKFPDSWTDSDEHTLRGAEKLEG